MSQTQKNNSGGRYIKVWAELHREYETLWVEEGEDAQAAVDHWFQHGDVVSYGFDEVEDCGE